MILRATTTGRRAPTRESGDAPTSSPKLFLVSRLQQSFFVLFFYTQKILLTLARTEKLAAANFFSAAPPGGGEAEHGC